jgi:hypothetical protein
MGPKKPGRIKVNLAATSKQSPVLRRSSPAVVSSILNSIHKRIDAAERQIDSVLRRQEQFRD